MDYWFTGLLPVQVWLILMLIWFYLAKFSWHFYIHRYLCHNQFTMNPFFLNIVRIWVWLNFAWYWNKGAHYMMKLIHTVHHHTADTDKDPTSPYRFKMTDFIFQKNGIYNLDYNDYREYGLKKNIREKNTEPKGRLPDFLFANKNLGIVCSALLWTTLAGIWGLLFVSFYKFVSLSYLNVSNDYYEHKGFGYKHPDDISKAKQRNPWPFIEGLHSNHHVMYNKINTKNRWFEIDFFYLQIRLLEILKLVKINETSR